MPMEPALDAPEPGRKEGAMSDKRVLHVIIRDQKTSLLKVPLMAWLAGWCIKLTEGSTTFTTDLWGGSCLDYDARMERASFPKESLVCKVTLGLCPPCKVEVCLLSPIAERAPRRRKPPRCKCS